MTGPTTRVVITDADLFDDAPATYATTDFARLGAFAALTVEDVINGTLRAGDIYKALGDSGADALGVAVPFLNGQTLGSLIDPAALFDASIGGKIDVTDTLLRTPGRDALTDYRLPLSDDAEPKLAQYSDLRGAFSFGVALNDEWPVKRVDVAAGPARQALDDLVADLNAAFAAAGVPVAAANVDAKIRLKATDAAVKHFAVVPVAADAGKLSPAANGFDPSILAAGGSRFVQVVGTTAGGVVGTNFYSLATPVAAAAVHAGLVNDGESALVKVTRIGSRPDLGGQVRNGIASSDGGGEAYLIESAADDLRRLGLVDFNAELQVIDRPAGGAATGTLPFRADLGGPAELRITAGGQAHDVTVPDNGRATVADALADVRAALAAAGVAPANLRAGLVGPDGAEAAAPFDPATEYHLRLSLVDGGAWTDFSLAPTSDATADRAVRLGLLVGAASANPRPAALRTIQDFADPALFPSLTIAPSYDPAAGAVRLDFAAAGPSAKSGVALPATFDDDLSPLGKITPDDPALTLPHTSTANLAFGLEFDLGPSGAAAIASGTTVPTDGKLSGDADFTLDLVLQDRFRVSVPAAWTAGNASVQDLVGDLNLALQSAVAADESLVDLTADRLVARRGLQASQIEFTTASPTNGGAGLTVANTHGVLPADLLLPFTHEGASYLLTLAAADTVGNATFGDLVAQINAAVPLAVVDANGNGAIDLGEPGASLGTDVFFTTFSGPGGAAAADELRAFATVPTGAAWPAALSLSADRADPIVAQLGFDDGAGAARSSVTARAASASPKLRNATDGSALVGGTVIVGGAPFAGTVGLGLNTLHFSDATAGATAAVGLRLADPAGASLDALGGDLAGAFARTLTAADGTGAAAGAILATGITRPGIDPADDGIADDARIEVSIPDLAAATVVAPVPLGVPIPVPGSTGGVLRKTTAVNFLDGAARYSVTVDLADAADNASFADLARDFDAALASVVKVENGVVTEGIDARGLFTITKAEGTALQVNALKATPNPDYARVTLGPSAAAFGEVGVQGTFGLGTIAAALRDALPVLDRVQAGTRLLSDFELPLIRRPVGELIDIKGDLLNRLDALAGASAAGLDDIAPAVAAALGVPAGAVTLTFDAANTAYRLDLTYETGSATAAPLNLSLADFYRFTNESPPEGFDSFNDTAAASPLAVKVRAITTLALGIDLADPTNPRPFLYGRDEAGGTGGTGVDLQIEASADGINLTAAVGAFGVYVRGGSVSLGGTPREFSGSPIYTYDASGKRLHYDRATPGATLSVAVGGAGQKLYLHAGAGEADALDADLYDAQFDGAVEASLAAVRADGVRQPRRQPGGARAGRGAGADRRAAGRQRLQPAGAELAGVCRRRGRAGANAGGDRRGLPRGRRVTGRGAAGAGRFADGAGGGAARHGRRGDLLAGFAGRHHRRRGADGARSAARPGDPDRRDRHRARLDRDGAARLGLAQFARDRPGAGVGGGRRVRLAAGVAGGLDPRAARPGRGGVRGAEDGGVRLPRAGGHRPFAEG